MSACKDNSNNIGGLYPEDYHVVIFWEQSRYQMRTYENDESHQHMQRIRYVQKKFEEKFQKPAPCRNVIEKLVSRFSGIDNLAPKDNIAEHRKEHNIANVVQGQQLNCNGRPMRSSNGKKDNNAPESYYSQPLNVDDTVADPEMQMQADNVYAQVELQKRRALENKLRELQRKKNTMDDLLNEIANSSGEPNWGGKSSRAPLSNLGSRSGQRYEADGSEEDEQRQLRPGFVSTSAREASLTSKFRELERTEHRLKQIEQIMRLIEEQELACDTSEFSSQHNSHNSPRKASNEELVNARLRGPLASERPANFEVRGQGSRPLDAATNQRNVLEPNEIVEVNGHPLSPSSVSSDPPHNVVVTSPPYGALSGMTAAAHGSQVPQSPSYDHYSPANNSANLFRDSFFRSMKSNLDSMMAMLESQQHLASQNQQNPLMVLVMMQNYQLIQQQQILLSLLGMQQQHPSNNPPALGPARPNICHHQSCNCGQASHFAPYNSPVFETPPSHQRSFDRRPNSEADMPPVNSPTNTQRTLNNNAQAAPLMANSIWHNLHQNQLSASANVSSGYNSSASKSNESLSANPFAFSTNFHGMAPQSTSSNMLPNNELNGNCLANGISSSMSFLSNPRLVRRPKKAANASNSPQMQPAANYHSNNEREKVQNAPSSSNEKQPEQMLDLSTLYTVLEKFVSDEKPKMKPNNLQQQQPSDNQELDIEGAVGGESVSSTNSEPFAEQQQSHQNLSRYPIHISPSTGAIRKKPRNQATPDTTSNVDLGSLMETIRPLMAAEGQSSESRQAGLVMTVPPAGQHNPHLLLKRPPTTGAHINSSPSNGRDDNEDSSSSSSDDDLAEADQSAEINGIADAEPIPHHHSSGSFVNSIIAHNGHGLAVMPNLLMQQQQQHSPEDQGAIGMAEEDEGNLSSTEANEEDGIRLSGDGEQGL